MSDAVSQVIWKYTFPIQDSFQIPMPMGSKILHVGIQGGSACMWALVDPKAPAYPHLFILVGTGQPIDPEVIRCCEHVATFQMPPFVWHLFAWKHEEEVTHA